MKSYLTVALAGASWLGIASAALAQSAGAPAAGQAEASPDAATVAQTANDEDAAPADIVVTARRRAESLQDVPQTVNAVTSEAIAELNLQRFEDVQAVVPGLQLTGGTSGFSTTATIRGASFQAESGASPTVEFYLNDALIQSVYLFQSMFDVGQIEVLRGPQGTLRGRSAPSGSITVTTRRPDLLEFGGYVSGTLTSTGGSNYNGALNLPIIRDMLSLRIAGIADENDLDEVRSINSTVRPYSRTKAGRASLRFEPTDSISAVVMYQTLERKLRAFDQVESLSISNPASPAVAPIIRASDRLGITDRPRRVRQEQDIVTGQVDWSFLGQRLSYVGSWSRGINEAFAPADAANVFPGVEFGQDLFTESVQETHELRLASEERLFGMFDYTVGAFGTNFDPDSDLTNRSAVTLFGQLRTIAETPIQRLGGSKERSVFANLTWHIGEQTELSGGARYIDTESDGRLIVNGNTLSTDETDETKTVYNVSLSHRFSDDFMVYANTGSAFRAGPFVIGVFRPATPRITRYTDLRPESSKSYEAGFKSNFLDNRLRFNASAFHQQFDGFIYRGVSVFFVDLTRQGPRPNTFNFAANVDAEVNGIEIDAAYQLDDRFSLTAAFSYAKGKIKNDFIACTDLNGDGVPDVNPVPPTLAQLQASVGTDAVAECRVNDRLSFAPNWTLTLQPEYQVPFSDRANGFLRGLLTYNPSNKQDPNNPFDNVDDYGLLNLYAGVRDADGAWEVSLFAKNILDTGVTLGRGNGPLVTSVQALQPPTFRTTEGQAIASSYTSARYTPPREFGVNVRWAFGSR